jgi:hypothetical protein
VEAGRARVLSTQGRGEAHRPSATWGAAVRRRGDDVQRRWRWSSAVEDLRKGNRPDEDRNRSRRGRGSSQRKELKGGSPETTKRGRPAVGKKVAAAQQWRSHDHGRRRPILSLLRLGAAAPWSSFLLAAVVPQMGEKEHTEREKARAE